MKPYRFILFKMKGHTTWRFMNQTTIPSDFKGEVTDRKIIEIDRLTGKVTEKLIEGIIGKVE